MFWEQQIQHSTATDVGLRRQNNEDAAAVHICSDSAAWQQRGHVLVVADGMGGHAVGEVASSMAIESVPADFLESRGVSAAQALKRAFEGANQSIHARGMENPEFQQMGTTCTALVLGQEGALLAHVGDSRAYRIRRDRIDQLTFDHSLSWEIQKHRPDLIDQADLLQTKNIITRSLGPEEEVQVDMEGPHPIAPGDVYLLCTDGLSNLLHDDEIGAVARELPVRHAARLLVNLANSRGGPDNVTVVVARVGELPANVQPEPVNPEPVVELMPKRVVAGWVWSAGVWCSLGALLTGLAFLVQGNRPVGAVLTGMAGSALIGLTYALGSRRRRRLQGHDAVSRTWLSRVYRTAVCLSSEKLHLLLIETAADLQRTAREDGWNVAWSDYELAVQSAQTDARGQRYSKSVRHLARGIDLLMSARGKPAQDARTTQNLSIIP